MNFMLRILFSGLIAFVPSQDGKELTVLLLNVGHSHHSSDGTALGRHTPLLLARGGSCSGDCPTRDANIAQFVFADQASAAALDSLEDAVSGGGAWQLSGSELSLAKGSETDPDLPDLVLQKNVRGTVNGDPQSIPTTAAEREDYSWIADMKQLCPTGCGLNQDIFATQPPSGLIAARLRLKNGKVFTRAVARIGDDVTPVHFNRLDGTGSSSTYSQAIATWVGADVEISGDSIEIVEDKFNGGTGRTMTLSPDANGKVEVAVLNLPRFVPPASSANVLPDVGKHFEMYYELHQTPHAAETRLVPRAGAASGSATYPQISWSSIHPSTDVYSDLLNKLRLDIGRGPYDRVICPPVSQGNP
jgi:hypothetical protein